jgi:hypothetical protein
MGSFNTTCALTRSIIDSDTDVVMLLLTKKPTYRGMPVHAWDLYAPVPILIEGSYSGYGTLTDAKLFQSAQVLKDDELQAVGKILFEDLKSVMVSENKKPFDNSVTSFDELLAERDFAFVKSNMRVEIAKKIIEQHSALVAKPETAAFAEQILQTMGYKTIEEAQEYVKKNEGTVETAPISFMMFRKDAFMKLMNEYGVGNDNEDHYAPKVQKDRQALANGSAGNSENMQEMMDFLTKPTSYSGANRPEYTYEHAIKGNAKKAGKVREDMITLSKLHCLDITLLNDYFTVLGIPFQPTMYVSEEINSYGHKEAFAMQQSLLSSVEPKKKIKP